MSKLAVGKPNPEPRPGPGDRNKIILKNGYCVLPYAKQKELEALLEIDDTVLQERTKLIPEEDEIELIPEDEIELIPEDEIELEPIQEEDEIELEPIQEEDEIELEPILEVFPPSSRRRWIEGEENLASANLWTKGKSTAYLLLIIFLTIPFNLAAFYLSRNFFS